MTDALVLAHDEDGAHILTLNRPEKRNAMNMELLEELSKRLDEVKMRDDIRTVILRGEGKCFSAGIDLMSLGSLGMSLTHAKFRQLVYQLQGLTHQLARLEKPVICVMHGFALGMSIEFAAACDVRLVEAGCKLNIAETRLGMIPDVGGCSRLTRLIGIARAKEMIMTGKDITTDQAERWGLVNEVVEPGQGLAAARRWHQDFCQAAPLAVGMAKIVIDRAYDVDLYSSMTIEALVQSTLFASEDLKEGVMARVEKRPPKWQGK